MRGETSGRALGSPVQVFRLGEWRVEPVANTVSRDGETVHLQPKVMDVLLFLVGHQGRVVPREEILNSVWPDTYVADVALSRCISQLRQALNDDRGSPSYIETVPKRGYRLIAPVSSADDKSRRRWFLGRRSLGLTAAIGLGAVISLEFTNVPWRLSNNGDHSPSVAFAPGAIEPPGKIGEKTASQENQEAQELCSFARYFHNREWEASNFEKAARYYQEAIRVDPAYAPAYAGLAQAYLGLDRWGEDRVWAEKAEHSAMRALTLNPSLSDGHVAMGLILELYHGDYAGAEAAFQLALSLNPDDVNAHREYGLLLLRYLGRFDEALMELQHAQDLDPLLAPLSSNLAEAYRARGEYDKAVFALARRIELEPRTVAGATNMAYCRLALGDVTAALEWSAKALETQPGYKPALQLRILAWLFQKDLRQAGETFDLLLKVDGRDAQSLAVGGLLALAEGNPMEADKFLADACRVSAGDFVWPLDVRVATLRGYVLQLTGRRQESELWLDQSTRMDAEAVERSAGRFVSPAYFHNSAVVQAIRGETTEACRRLTEAIEKGWKAWLLNRPLPFWADLEANPCIQSVVRPLERDLAKMRRRLSDSEFPSNVVLTHEDRHSPYHVEKASAGG
ncbi:MAG TPA: winged helix-turn-helix domain-containing protein [Acidobacteriota bacterium]|nr:winged helix-turn-helix domain-containing protein [Acidobacteriota bacterium]